MPTLEFKGIIQNKQWFSCLFLLMGMVFFGTESLATEQHNIEYKIKGGYLYSFTKFITWPTLELQTFNLCIIGDDPFGSLLDPIEKKSVLGKPIRLIRMADYSSNLQCHIAYIKPLQFQSIPTVIQAPDTSDETRTTTLIVSDQADFSRTDALIHFVLSDDKVKLKIDLDKFRASGLDISAKLLEVAEIVGGAN